MPTPSKHIVLALLALFAALLLPTQAVAQLVPGYQYVYDASGNRLSRVFTQVQLKRGDTTETKTLVGNYEVSIFPNPTKGLLKINIAGLKADLPAQVFVSDISGKALFGSVFHSGENIVNLSGYPIGIYLMRLVIGDKSETYKVMKSD